MDNINKMLNDLEAEREALKTKLKGLNQAIDGIRAFMGDDHTTPVKKTADNKRQSKPRIAWRSEILDLFDTQDTWSISEVYDRMVEQGHNLDPVSAKGSISTTLGRLCDDDLVEKIEAGTYKRTNKSSGPKNRGFFDDQM